MLFEALLIRSFWLFVFRRLRLPLQTRFDPEERVPFVPADFLVVGQFRLLLHLLDEDVPQNRLLAVLPVRRLGALVGRLLQVEGKALHQGVVIVLADLERLPALGGAQAVQFRFQRLTFGRRQRCLRRAHLVARRLDGRRPTLLVVFAQGAAAGQEQ